LNILFRNMEAPQLDPTSLALPLSPQPENNSAETNSPSDDPNHAAPSKRDIHDTESALNISSDTLLALPQHVAVESSEEYTLDNRAATPVEVVPGTPDQLPLYGTFLILLLNLLYTPLHHVGRTPISTSQQNSQSSRQPFTAS